MNLRRIQEFRIHLTPFWRMVAVGTVAKTAITLVIWLVLTLGYFPRPALEKAATQLAASSSHVIETIMRT
jgi:hypothetical protein